MDGSNPLPLDEAPRAQNGVNQTVASRYEILEMVGEGPFLAAFRARDRELNRIVSFKTPLPVFADRADVKANLRDGVARVLAFNHANITRTFDLGEDAERNNALFVAEEYVRGIDLKERIRRVAPFQLTAANEVALALAEALEYAHARGVNHGDVRPQNVLIGPDSQVKLTNFGIADAQNLLVKENAEALPVALPYRAPELADNAPLTPSADLFALGAILFEMLTGDTPARGGPEAPSPREINQAVPRALDGIVRKALAPAPAARYVSASEFVRDLRLVRDALRFGKPLAWSPLDAPLPPILVTQPIPDVPLADVPLRATPVGAPLSETVPAPVAPPRVPVPPPPPPDGEQTIVMPGTGQRSVVATTPVIAATAPVIAASVATAAVEAAPAVAAATIAQAATTPVTAVYADPLDPETTLSAATNVANDARRRSRKRKREDDLTNYDDDYKPPRASNAGKWLAFINLFLFLLALGAMGSLAYITFNLLQPPREVVVPNLVGKSLSEARAMAHEQAFALATVDRQFRDKEPDDMIFQMNPQAGRHIRAGKPVSIWVSNGPKMVEVPDVRDIGLDKGRRILEKNGLRIGELRYEYDTLTAKGNILRQLPEWGENRPRGTRIDLVLSKGEEPPPPPLVEPSPSPFPLEPNTVGELDPQGDKVRVIGISGYDIPDDGMPHRLRIDVEDKNGRRTVFDENREPGEKFSQDVECIGKKVTVILYDNDVAKATKTQTFKD